MKKLILVLMLALIPGLSLAGSQEIQSVVMMAKAQGGDSCTGDLLFSWHMENTTVTSGTPAGCSAGDTTATTVSGAELSATYKSDGTYSASIPTSGDRFTFTASGGDIAKRAAGTISFDLYLSTTPATGAILVSLHDTISGKRIDVKIGSATDEIGIRYASATDTSATTTTANLTTGVWYSVVAKWDVAAGTKLSVSANSATATSTMAITQLANEIDSVAVGDSFTQTTNGYYIDNLKIYGTWQ